MEPESYDPFPPVIPTASGLRSPHNKTTERDVNNRECLGRTFNGHTHVSHISIFVKTLIIIIKLIARAVGKAALFLLLQGGSGLGTRDPEVL